MELTVTNAHVAIYFGAKMLNSAHDVIEVYTAPAACTE